METFLKLIKIAFVILNAYVALKLSMLVFDRNFMRFDNQVRLPLMVVVLLIELNFIIGFLAAIRESRSLVVINASVNLLILKLIILSGSSKIESGLMVSMFFIALLAIPLNIMIKAKEKRQMLRALSARAILPTISQAVAGSAVNFDGLSIAPRSPSIHANRHTLRSYSQTHLIANSDEHISESCDRHHNQELPLSEVPMTVMDLPPPYEDCVPPKYEDVVRL